MKNKALIDSNILVYAFNKQSPYHLKAKRFLQTKLKEESIFLALQNLAEMFATLTKGVENPIPQPQALQIVEYFMYHSPALIIAPTGQIAHILIKSLRRYPYITGQKIFDLQLAVLMVENNIRIIYTKNAKDFSRIKEIKAIDPL